MNRYQALKEKQQAEIDNFPLAFAFSDAQFKSEMERLGLTEDDTGEVYSIGSGGFLRKEDAKSFSNMLSRFDDEMQEAIDADETGFGFIYDMFDYEMANHEYGYTHDLEDTLRALGITEQNIEQSSELQRGLQSAQANY